MLWEHVNGAIGSLWARREDSPEYAGLIEYLTQCRDVVRAELKRQTLQGAEPDTVRLPRIESAERQMEFENLIHEMRDTDALKPFLGRWDKPWRVVSDGEEGAFAWWRETCAEELQNVFILDASYPIRELCTLDPTIRTLPHLSEETLLGLKRYDRVTVHQMIRGGGRSGMTRALGGTDRTLIDDTVALVKSIPQNESILIFGFKPRDEQGSRQAQGSGHAADRRRGTGGRGR